MKKKRQREKKKQKTKARRLNKNPFGFYVKLNHRDFLKSVIY